MFAPTLRKHHCTFLRAGSELWPEAAPAAQVLGKGAVDAASVRREVVHALALSDMPRSQLEAHSTGGPGAALLLDQVIPKPQVQIPTLNLSGGAPRATRLWAGGPLLAGMGGTGDLVELEMSTHFDSTHRMISTGGQGGRQHKLFIMKGSSGFRLMHGARTAPTA